MNAQTHKTGKPIALISAVRFEADLLLAGAKQDAGAAVVTLPLKDKEGENALYVCSGMGATNAARATTMLIERASPSLVIVFGIGGAYPGSGPGIGDVVLAEREIYADTGVALPGGVQGVQAIGIPLLRKGGREYFNEFPLNTELLGATAGQLQQGVFLTVAAATGTDQRARELQSRHAAVCENMEGAAVAHVCAFYGVPVIELRGISNMVGERDLGKWDKTLAAMNCQQELMALIPGL